MRHGLFLTGIAGQLNALGVIGHFADVVGGKLTTMNMGWPAVCGLLSLAYYGLHYMFASQTAHVGALYSAFLAMMLSAGELTFNICSDTFNLIEGQFDFCCSEPADVGHSTLPPSP